MFPLRLISPSIVRNVKHVNALAGCITANGSYSPAVLIHRTYMKRKTIKIPPTKPLNFDYSGDLVKNLPEPAVDAPKPGFEDIEELQEAEEAVKKIFSLEFGDSRDLLKTRLKTITEKFKTHPADVQSLEYVISLQTVLIRNLTKHCLQFRRDKYAKSQLVERIQSRRSKLKKLREKDYDKFIWLLEELQIKYVPFGEYDYVKLGKRETRIKNARDAALAVEKQKKEELRQKLEAEREYFEDIKKQELARIEKELGELGIEPQETLEATINMLKFGIPTVKKEPYKKRRQLLLEQKFKAKAAKKAEQEAINFQKALYNM